MQVVVVVVSRVLGGVRQRRRGRGGVAEAKCKTGHSDRQWGAAQSVVAAVSDT